MANLTILAQVADLGGPLTKQLNEESFSDKVVPFTWTTWIVVGLCFLLILAHEAYAAKVKPLLTNHQGNTLQFQWGLLYYWFYGYANESMLIPVTLDFALSMGENATMSGLFIGVPLVGAILGIFLGKKVVNEHHWDHALARRFVIWCTVVSSMVMLLEAAVSNCAAHLSVGSKQTVFWIMTLLSNMATFVGALPFVPLYVMWGKITPKCEMSFWMVLTQCARQGGLLFGPAIFALVSLLVRRGKAVAPSSLTAWVILGQALLGLLSALLSAAVIPIEEPPEEPLEEEETAPETEHSVELLEVPKRQQVVQGMIFYAFERQCVTAAIEVSTIMLLEVSYGWSVELSGTVFVVVSLASLAFAALSSVMMSRRLVQESMVFFTCNAIALVGVFFLFDFGTGVWGLLVADGLVYGCASVSNGIAEGWASKAAVPDTKYSTEAYRTWNITLASSARLMAPVVARTVLDFGGRNLYAALQLVMVGLGASTVYKAVSMVWDLQSRTEPSKNGKDS